MENVLSIRNLKKHIMIKINNLNIDIKGKEIVAFVGPSGCGKSTLLGILARLKSKSDGSIFFNGRKKLGYML